MSPGYQMLVAEPWAVYAIRLMLIDILEALCDLLEPIAGFFILPQQVPHSYTQIARVVMDQKNLRRRK